MNSLGGNETEIFGTKSVASARGFEDSRDQLDETYRPTPARLCDKRIQRKAVVVLWVRPKLDSRRIVWHETRLASEVSSKVIDTVASRR